MRELSEVFFIQKLYKCSDSNAKEARDIARSSFLSKDAEITINKAAQTYDLSARGYHRTIKLARTIADIEGSEYIKVPHIMEALQYRQRQFKKD